MFVDEHVWKQWKTVFSYFLPFLFFFEAILPCCHSKTIKGVLNLLNAVEYMTTLISHFLYFEPLYLVPSVSQNRSAIQS